MNIVIGNKLCSRAKLYLPWAGRPVLEVHLDGAAPSGDVVVQWGKTRIAGTVVPDKSGQSVGAGVVTIVCGIGWQTPPPSAWLVDNTAAPSRVATQLAQAVGESLVIGQGALREGRTAYARANQPASVTLENLLAKNALWWVDLDGTTNAATDRPGGTCKSEALHVEPNTRRVRLAAEEPSEVLPGLTIPATDERLEVSYRIREAWLEADENGVTCWVGCDGVSNKPRVAELLESIIAGQTAHMFFRGATVQSQDAQGRVSLRLEERDKELADSLPVPVWCGVPGVSAEIFFGARTMLAFDRADPTNPFAALWSPLGQTGHVPRKVAHEANEEIRFVGASAGVVKVGAAPTSPVALAGNLVAYLQALEAYLLTIDATLTTLVGPVLTPLITARTTAAGNISSIASSNLEAK